MTEKTFKSFGVSRTSCGFTLLEVLTVVAIIAILGAVAAVSYQNYTARAKASEIVLQYDALRTGTLVKLSQSSVESCDKLAAALNDSVPVNSQHVALGYDFVPASGGFRPVLTVCAKADAQYPLAVKVARGVHDTMAKAGDTVSPGAQLLDSVVSFSLRLSDGERAVCKRAVSQSRTNCDAGTPAPTRVAAMQATPPGQAPSPKQQAPVVPPPDPGPAPVPGLAPMQTPSLKQPTTAVAPPTPLQQRVPTPRPAEPAAQPAQCALVDPATGRSAAFPPGSTYDPKTNPNPNPLPRLAPGSECVVCGDPNKGTPCSDLDLMLAITAVCPDDKPFCSNQTINDGGVFKEYRRCVDNATVTAGLQKNKDVAGACLRGMGPDRQQPIGTCNAFCYGDLCNSDTNPNSGLQVTQCR